MNVILLCNSLNISKKLIYCYLIAFEQIFTGLQTVYKLFKIHIFNVENC